MKVCLKRSLETYRTPQDISRRENEFFNNFTPREFSDVSPNLNLTFRFTLKNICEIKFCLQ